MTENTPARRLPVRLPPHSDELLSSWIGRHAAFYAVPPLVMLRHCLPEAPSLRAADLHLSSDQEARLANIFGTEPAAVHRITFVNVAEPSRRLIATRPTQFCPSCSSGGAEPAPVLRSQPWVGGRHCSTSADATDSENHTPPARPLAVPRARCPHPDLDHVVAEQQENLPTPAKPILPLHLRLALLAGVAIVERSGPEMLQMLRGHMMGDNRVRFTEAVQSMIGQAPRTKACSQMQLI